MALDKNVDAYIERLTQWQTEVSVLRALMLQTSLQESIKWGTPTYTINAKNVVAIGAFKSYFGLWFFNGALLKDKKGYLVNAQEGKTKAMRQWRFSSVADIESIEVLAYTEEAIALQKAGKVLVSEKSTVTADIPAELKHALASNAELAEQFDGLTAYKQKEYIQYIGSAKKEATRHSRLTKCIPILAAGEGLNDKYRNC